jgi:hypothetical protein
MKKFLLTTAIAVVGMTAFAQNSDVQNATLNTTIPTMIALRPYSSQAANNQSLSATVTTSGVLNGNKFDYAPQAGSDFDGLAYRIYSNMTYKVSLQSSPTGGSNDQLNNYINFHAVTLASPQNGLAPWPSNGNGDHTIDVPSDTRLAYATSSPMDILHNSGYNTGKYLVPSAPFQPLDPVATDFAAFGIKFSVSPGFSVFPGTFQTNLVITATAQ